MTLVDGIDGIDGTDGADGFVGVRSERVLVRLADGAGALLRDAQLTLGPQRPFAMVGMDARRRFIQARPGRGRADETSGRQPGLDTAGGGAHMDHIGSEPQISMSPVADRKSVGLLALAASDEPW